jgi:DNA-binding NarL/FixJ family response regulator
MTWRRDADAASLLTPLSPELVAEVRGGLLQLTRAESRVAIALLTGSSNEDIAQALCVSKRTIEEHVASILRKCGCTRFQFMRICCGDLATDGIVVHHITRSAAAPRNSTMLPLPSDP